MSAGAAEPGSLAEEASRLFEAVQDWARRGAAGTGPHIGGAPECSVCPICQGLAMLRSARPEAFAHLAEAMAALVAAARDLLDAHAAHGAGADEGGRRGVERIDIG